MSDQSIYDRIRAGEFKPTLAYPTRPKEPAILGKSVKQLSDSELASIPAVRATYAADKAAFEAANIAYRREATACEEAFVAALHDYHGMTGHPKADKVYSKAYERGHHAGFEEVASAYDDYVDLVER
jgi:hypothetical protein